MLLGGELTRPSCTLTALVSRFFSGAVFGHSQSTDDSFIDAGAPYLGPVDSGKAKE
jgi:hypothetical protein